MTFFQIGSQNNPDPQSFIHANKTKDAGTVSTCEPLQVMTKLFAQQNLHDIPATTLTQIPSHDREESMYDIHGVKSLAVEDPDLVETRSQALIQLLVDRKNRNTTRPQAYEWVLENAQEFMTQQVVKALRAESFDIEKAAKRLQSHFQMKLEYFGLFSLGRELELQDLGPEERDLLQLGGKQLLPVRDRSGRGICIGFPAANSQYSAECKAKVMFWLCSIAARDVEIQRRGVIWIFWIVGGQIGKDVSSAVQQCRTLAPSLARTAAIHVCFDDSTMTTTINTAISFLDTFSLIRLQSHFGSNLECRYNLMTFGVPLNAIPISHDNIVQCDRQCDWMKRLEAEEAAGSERTMDGLNIWNNSVAPPGPIDVVVGKGNLLKRFTGNFLMKRLIENRRREYDTSGRGGKGAIVDEIFQELKKRGIRFLSPIGGKVLDDLSQVEWVEVEDQVAKDRIGHSFRNIRNATKPPPTPIPTATLELHSHDR